MPYPNQLNQQFPMKKILLFISLLGVTVCSFAKANQSINKTGYEFSINPAIVAGVESGASLRLEWVKETQTKLFVNAETGLLLKDGDFILADIGFGYGRQMWQKGNNTFYLNGLLSCMLLTVPVGLPRSGVGPTTLFELEYRKTWNRFSLQVAPFYRQLFLYQSNFGSDGMYLTGSAGLRLGVLWRL